MRFLVAPLQPDTRLSADFSGIQLHSVIPAGHPFADWPQMGDVSEDIFVRITLVARCHHEGIHFQTLLALERRVVLLGRVDVDAHAVFGAVVLHARDLAGWQNPVLPLLLVGVLHALQVEIVVDLLDQLETDNAVVGGTVCGERALALFGGQVVEFLNPFGVKYFIHTDIISMPLNQLRWGGKNLQWRVITGTHGRVSHDQSGARVGIPLLQVVEDLSGTLATSENGNVVRVELILKHGGQGGAILGRVHDARVLGQLLRHLRLASDSNDHLARLSGHHLAGLHITREHRKVIDNGAVGIRLAGDHLGHLLSVRHDILEAVGTPAHVVFKLQTSGEEGAQVGEMDQSIFLVEVVEEGEAAARITEGGEIFDKGDLHPRAGDQHARMPGKLFLTLEKADLGLEVGIGARGAQSRVQRIVQSNGNGQRGGAKPNANEIMELFLRRSLQTGRILRRLNRLHGGGSLLLGREIDLGLPENRLH